MQALQNDSDEDDGDIIPAPYHQSTIPDNDNRVNTYDFDDIDDTDYNIDSESPTTVSNDASTNANASAYTSDANAIVSIASNVSNVGNAHTHTVDKDNATINRNEIANYITTQWQVLGAKQAEKNASIMQAQSMQPVVNTNANYQQVQASYPNQVDSQYQLAYAATNSESSEPVMPTSANMQSNQQYYYNQTESQQYDDNQTQQFYEDNVNIGLDGDAYMNAIQNHDDEQSELIVDTANKDAGYDWLNGGKDKKNRMKRKIHAYLKMSIIIGLTVIIILGAIILGKSSMPDYDGFNHQQEIENQNRIEQDKKQHTNNASYSQQNPIITKV